VLSIIIPTLNCRDELLHTLDALAMRPEAWEIIVSDGGSVDGTREAAELAGVRALSGPKGRGRQLAAGAEAARGPWFLFWHADTHPQPGWVAIVEHFIRDPKHEFHAAYFALVLNDPKPEARRIENLANWRARTLGLPYGDQGLLISEDYYNHLGGFKPIPIMEDVDLVRRIGQQRLHPLPAAAVTSAKRYRRDGWWLRPAKNLLCLVLFFFGVPPAMIWKIYR
jgi:rSAM/selenodomain-associated transferase 2